MQLVLNSREKKNKELTTGFTKGHGWGGWGFFPRLGMCREELG